MMILQIAPLLPQAPRMNSTKRMLYEEKRGMRGMKYYFSYSPTLIFFSSQSEREVERKFKCREK
jgi:hypothetical protein